MQTRSLRVAAYLLVAHFLIIAAWTLLGRGSPDLYKLAISLGFLIGAVGALFKPYKLGWLMVVAYALHSMSPFLVGTWALWASTEWPMVAKIGASAILAVASVPLVAALVMVFRPAGFAAFKPVVDAAAPPVAKTAPGPEEEAGRGRGKSGRIVKIAAGAAVLLTLALFAIPAVPKIIALVVALFLLAYLPITPLALRVKFRHRVLRYFYGLTAVPVFAVIFLWMLHRLFSELPVLAATFSAAMANGGRHAGMAHALVVVIPTLLLFALWYGLLRMLDNGIGRLESGAGTAVAATIVFTFLAGILFVAHDAGVIGSDVWRVSRSTYGGAMPNKAWLNAAQLDQELGRWRRTWIFPRRVVGQCHNNIEWYRVEWKVLDEGQRYYAYYGIPQETYERYGQDLLRRGYSLDSMTQFRDCSGKDRFQATWSATNPQK
jgi:hypothetical protein